VNLRPYYAEARRQWGFEIAEQLGGACPTTSSAPWPAVRSSSKIRKAFKELVALGLVEDRPVKFFGAQPRDAAHLDSGEEGNRSD